MALFKILRGNAANLPTTKKDGYAYFCTDTHDFYIDYTNASGKLTRGQLNAYQADKLSAGRNINLDTAVSSTATVFDGSKNITIPVTGVKEAYLTWGGKNLAGSSSPLDASMIPQLGANRFAFLKEAGILVEYSRDSGTTWTEIESTTKHRLFGAMGSNFAGYTIGNNITAGADTSTYQLRVTIDSVTAGIYSVLKKFAINVSTSGGQNCWCSIEAKTAADVDSGNDVWTKFADQVAIIGWSGWNIINTTTFTSYSGSDSQKSQYQKIRFIFGNQSHSGNNYKGLTIQQIFAFGENAWKFPSSMAKYGTLYSYDCEQNATFPAQVAAKSLISNGTLTVGNNAKIGGTLTVTGNTTATSITASGKVTSSEFIGNLTGNADTATEANQSKGIMWAYFDDMGVIS